MAANNYKKAKELLSYVEKTMGAAPAPWEKQLAGLDPDFFEAYSRYVTHPWVKGVLPPKVRELILLAANASVTHLYRPGIETQVRRALEAGATMDEILEVLEEIAVLGIHSVTVGIMPLVDEYEKKSPANKRRLAAMAKKGARTAADILEKHPNTMGGPPSDGMLKFAQLQPECYKKFFSFYSHVWVQGTLPAKVKQLIYVALDANVTHIFERGLRRHISFALAAGATLEEVLEVLQLCSGMGSQTLAVGVPFLIEEYEKRQKSQSRKSRVVKS